MTPDNISAKRFWRAGIRRVRRLRIRYVWFMRDWRQSRKESAGIVECPICHNRKATELFKKLVSRCIFGGGALQRYECPNCGVIFGPQKMLSLSPQELDRDYRAHYSCYSEGDTNEAVLDTFRHLNPSLGCRYLNYGCGQWSKPLRQIRSQGYDIVGFDPYVADPDDPSQITDVRELAGMRFDGIMSHNLLEHLVDPRSSLAFMSSLLAENGVMAHSTECFEYRHEYSRFHLFFFTGRSLDVLSKNSGLLCTAAPTKYIRIFKPYRTMR